MKINYERLVIISLFCLMVLTIFPNTNAVTAAEETTVV